MTEFNPSVQDIICSDKELCYFGDFPTIAEINNRFSVDTSAAWLIPQLTDLSEFCGCKEKLQDRPLEECAFLIAQNYYYLKISELMLFFSRFKLGCYGIFYGSVDPLKIMQALRQFVIERNAAYSARQAEAEREKRQNEAKNSVSYAEYLELKRIKTAEKSI